MLKKYSIIICFSCFIVLSSISGLYALGVGGYISGKGGVSTLKIGDTNSSVDYSVGAGFVLDTAVATNEVFNYRLAVGYENSVKSGVPFFSTWSTHRISFSNVLGYAFYRSKYLRVWMGPQIGLACQFVNAKDKEIQSSPNTIGYRIRFHSDNFAIFSLGFGAVLGINVHPADNFTISFEIGINSNVGIGPRHEKRRDYTIAYGFPIMPTLVSSNSHDIIFGKAEGLARLSFIYRVGGVDIFVPEAPQNVDIKLLKK
jgi:hypothetical protein